MQIPKAVPVSEKISFSMRHHNLHQQQHFQRNEQLQPTHITTFPFFDGVFALIGVTTGVCGM